MKNVANAIVLQLDYVDNNRPDFKGDPDRVPSIRNILIDHVTIEGSKNAGRIVGLPESRIEGVTFEDMRIQAEKDLVVKDAEPPVFANVTRDIRLGVAPSRARLNE
jgi:hypothetical protein